MMTTVDSPSSQSCFGPMLYIPVITKLCLFQVA